MSENQFFEKKGPFPLSDIVKTIGYDGDSFYDNNFKIHGFESLDNANKNDITFLNSIKYKEKSLKTRAGACITSYNLSKFLPKKCIKLNVKNVLFAVTKASRMFYTNADIDPQDSYLTDSEELKKDYPNIKFGKNILIGKNV